jgi:GNAT superfamily N-acetyltransferase
MISSGTIDRREIFDLYREERRASVVPGYCAEVMPALTRYTAERAGEEGFVVFARFRSDDADAIIGEQIAYFEGRGEPFEWKVYDFDFPVGLRGMLGSYGFRSGPVECFMVLPLRNVGFARGGEAIIEDATLDNGVIDDIIRVQDEVWKGPRPGLDRRLRDALATRPASASIHCAYLDGRPVGTGWVDFTRGSRFADLHGGAVLESARGRGIYTQLYERRIAAAMERGCRYLAVDATDMSRPILQKKGFIAVCETVPMRSGPAGEDRSG